MREPKFAQNRKDNKPKDTDDKIPFASKRHLRSEAFNLKYKSKVLEIQGIKLDDSIDYTYAKSDFEKCKSFVFDCIEKNQSVFYSAPNGAGKSHFLREIESKLILERKNCLRLGFLGFESPRALLLDEIADNLSSGVLFLLIDEIFGFNYFLDENDSKYDKDFINFVPYLKQLIKDKKIILIANSPARFIQHNPIIQDLFTDVSTPDTLGDYAVYEVDDLEPTATIENNVEI